MESAALVFYYANPRLALGLSCILVFFIYYLIGVAKKPMFFCREGNFRKFLLASCPILRERYWPTLWCFGTHAQTALANILRGRLPDLPYQRELLTLKDSGLVSLDWLDSHWCKDKHKQPIALFLPGLTGHSQTEYVKSLVPVAQRLGCRCVVFNNRGRGGVDLVSTRTYCASVTDDLKEVLAHIRTKHPHSPIIATGISMGGILLGHYMVESGEQSIISATLLISVVYDVHAAAASMETPGLNLMLNRHLARNLCDVLRPYRTKFSTDWPMDIDHVLESPTIRDFDERFTSKIFQFHSANDYYTFSTLRGRLNKIRVPTLCVNAADDMFAPFEALPTQEIEASDHVAMVITSRGGHIGFMEGMLPVAPFFSERMYEQYVGALVRIAAEGSNIKTAIC